MEQLKVPGELLVQHRPLTLTPESLFWDRSRDLMQDPAMRRVQLADLRLPRQLVDRNRDVRIHDAHPSVPPEHIQTFLECSELVERRATLIERVRQMHLTVVVLSDLDRLVVLGSRDDHELGEVTPVVRQRQTQDV